MTLDELLAKLETWPIGSTEHDSVLEAVPLMEAAARTIRTLREVILGGEHDATLVIHDVEDHRDMT